MSRIGKSPITIPQGVTVDITGSVVSVSGQHGQLKLPLPAKIKAEITDNIIYVSRLTEDKKIKACHGSTRAHIQNMVTGVVTPWKKDLEIRGTGFKFALQGNKLIVSAGYIHTVEVLAPEGVTFVLTDDTHLSITGANKEVVGQVASNIRKIRKPEPYKGKGIRYADEFIKLKAGKTAKA